MVILNTCHIREKAAEKVYSELGRLKPLKQQNKHMVIGVAGCVASGRGGKLPARPLSIWCSGRKPFSNCPPCWVKLPMRAHKAISRNWCARNFPHRKNLPLCRLRRASR